MFENYNSDLQSLMDRQITHIILEHRPILKKLAKKFTKDSAERDDLVQETFVRALKYLHKFIDHPKLVSWLYVIMKNIYLNSYRRAHIHRIAEKEIDYVQSMYKNNRNLADSKFVIEDINKSLESLSEENYKIFSMYIEGYKYYEIAEYMQIKEGTIKTRIHFIRKNLKNSLKDYAL